MPVQNVTLENLKAVHGEDALRVFKEIAVRGGFGDIPSNYAGGLDVGGISDAALRAEMIALASHGGTPPESPEKLSDLASGDTDETV